eukprot:scaffold46334_cov23-Tisochrysis_lutea.AAC.1
MARLQEKEKVIKLGVQHLHQGLRSPTQRVLRRSRPCQRRKPNLCGSHRARSHFMTLQHLFNTNSKAAPLWPPCAVAAVMYPFLLLPLQCGPLCCCRCDVPFSAATTVMLPL